MSTLRGRAVSFFSELNRRNIFKVGIAYTLTAWILLQLTDIVVDIFTLPDSAPKLLLVLLVIGIVPALVFAWIFEITPEGVKRAKDVDRSQSINLHTGHQLNRGIIMIFSIAMVMLLTERFRDELIDAHNTDDAKTESAIITGNNPDKND